MPQFICYGSQVAILVKSIRYCRTKGIRDTGCLVYRVIAVCAGLASGIGCGYDFPFDVIGKAVYIAQRIRYGG